MATRFCTDDTCEGEECKRTSQLLSYSVKERRRLCEVCASEKSTDPTQRADASWACQKHGEPIKFFCVQHNLVICQSCAIVAHQKHCELKDVDDVIKMNREKLKDIIPAAKDRMSLLQHQLKNIQKTSSEVHDHFDGVELHIRDHTDEEKEAERKKGKDKSLSIFEEAERKIQSILKERDEKVKHNLKELEVREKEVDEKGNTLLTELNHIREVVEKKIGGITEKSKYTLAKLDESFEEIEHALLRDQELCTRTQDLLAAVNDALQSHTDANLLQRIATTARGVKYFKRPRPEVGPNNRIDGFRGEWRLVDTVDIPKSIELPGLVGCIGEGSIVLRDKITGDLYLANLNTKATEEIVNAVDTIVSCASLDEKTIVCGKARKGAFSECICLYDADWQPKNAKEREETVEPVGVTKRVFVDVDSRGMILAADFMTSEITIIRPSDLTGGFDESVVATVPVKDNSTEGFQSLSSGDIVVKSGYGGLSVIDRAGKVKNFIQDFEWGCPKFSVDSLTDALYVVFKDSERMMYAVDKVCPTSGKVCRKIVEYPMSDDRRNISAQRCAVSPSGNLVTFNGDKLFFYKKYFSL